MSDRLRVFTNDEIEDIIIAFDSASGEGEHDYYDESPLWQEFAAECRRRGLRPEVYGRAVQGVGFG